MDDALYRSYKNYSDGVRQLLPGYLTILLMCKLGCLQMPKKVLSRFLGINRVTDDGIFPQEKVLYGGSDAHFFQMSGFSAA